MVRGKSSKRKWLKSHQADPFVQRAAAHGYRSRAVYKLIEIDERDRLLRPGLHVVELGSAPGGWSQYVAERVGPTGKLIAVDVLEMAAVPGVTVIRGDFCDAAVEDSVRSCLANGRADLVLSDLAPNITGIQSADEARAERLELAALEFARRTLKPGGDMLIKLLSGSGVEGVRGCFAAYFAHCAVRKPKASRPKSREFYLLARRFRGGEVVVPGGKP